MDNETLDNIDEGGSIGRPLIRRSAKIVTGTAFVLSLAVFIFTDSAPSVDSPPAPTAEQASAVRAAVSQLRTAQLSRQPSTRVEMTVDQLVAIGILASDAFRPDRMRIDVQGKFVNVYGSHRLFFGRWLNAGLTGEAGEKGFPEVKLTVGPVTFSKGISRFLLQAGRQSLNLVGTNIPPLDELIASSDITGNQATAFIRLPKKSGVFDVLGRAQLGTDALAVRTTYCRLSSMQANSPTDDFHVLLHRAFPTERIGVANVTTNRAAFVALAMMTVSPQAGELVGLSPEDVEGCQTAASAYTFKGRTDLSKHWSLSAALAVTTGTTLTESMGEWKELSDSVSAKSEFAKGDPTGFSFVDISADRSGFLTGQSAMDADRSRDFAASMAHISEDELLPSALLSLEDGLPAAEFKRKYGSIRDPRFLARIKQIDAVLNQRAKAGQAPGY